MKIINFVFVMALITTACVTGKPTSPSLFQGDQITLENGGGWAARFTKYIILEDGNVFVSESVGREPVWIKKLSSGKTKTCFDIMLLVDLADNPFSHLGNMTWSLGFRHKGVWNEVKWGEASVEVPVNFKSAYERIYQLITNK